MQIQIEYEISDLQFFLRQPARAAPRQGPDPRLYFTQFGRLDQIVIRACIQPGDLIFK
jgi:hypothetical protein